MASARAVISTASQLSVFIVGVPEEVRAVTLFVILLFVKVFVLEIVGTATPPTVGAFVLSISVAQSLVTLVPVTPIEPDIEILPEPNVSPANVGLSVVLRPVIKDCE
jgi:hypothetical protein